MLSIRFGLRLALLPEWNVAKCLWIPNIFELLHQEVANEAVVTLRHTTTHGSVEREKTPRMLEFRLHGYISLFNASCFSFLLSFSPHVSTSSSKFSLTYSLSHTHTHTLSIYLHPSLYLPHLISSLFPTLPSTTLFE